MGEIEPWHVVILLMLMFLLFGAKRMPEAARSLGRSLRIFKAEIKARPEQTREELATSSSSTWDSPDDGDAKRQ